MTRKKAGGRESDVSGETEAVRAAETGRVAANPAAWSRESPGYFLHTACAGRIRELEAEVAELKRSRASVLREHDALASAIAEGTRLRDLVARAEEAGARVELEVALAERVAERLAEADAVLERLGVTWSGKAYVGMAREKEEC